MGKTAAPNEKGARSPFVYELLSHISEHYLNREVLTPIKYSTSAHSVHVWAQGHKKYIVHLPLSAADETRLDRGLRAAAEIAKVTPIPTAPLVAKSSYKGIGFAMNVLSEGSSIRSIVSSRSEICNILAVLHQKTQSVAAPWREILRTTAERYAAALEGAAASRQAAKNILNSDRLNQLISYASDISGNGSSCAIHGDFWTENILEQNGKITAVWTGIDSIPAGCLTSTFSTY